MKLESPNSPAVPPGLNRVAFLVRRHWKNMIDLLCTAVLHVVLEFQLS